MIDFACLLHIHKASIIIIELVLFQVEVFFWMVGSCKGGLLENQGMRGWVSDIYLNVGWYIIYSGNLWFIDASEGYNKAV